MFALLLQSYSLINKMMNDPSSRIKATDSLEISLLVLLYALQISFAPTKGYIQPFRYLTCVLKVS